MNNLYFFKILLIFLFYFCYFIKYEEKILYNQCNILEKNNIQNKETKNSDNSIKDNRFLIPNKNNETIFFEAIYKTYKKNQNIILINEIYIQFIKDILIDDNIISPNYEYLFPEIGEHHVIIHFNLKMNQTNLMFYNVESLISINFSIPIFNSNINNIYGMFKNCINLAEANLYINSLSKIKNTSSVFQNCVSLSSLNFLNIISANTIDISYMFINCSSLQSIDLSKIDTSNVKYMTGLFYGCSSLKSIDLMLLNTSNTLNMNYMFAECYSLSKINMNSSLFNSLKDVSYMFKNCYKLTSIELSFMTSNRINKEGIFQGCEYLNKTKYDFCIIGYWFGTNYGSLATYYALHQAVRNMGYSVLMIDNPLSKTNISDFNKCDPRTIGRSLYNISEHKPLDKVIEFNDECKGFLVGSDQLWKPFLSRPFKQFFFLDFVFNNKKKIAYATSFGEPYSGTDEERQISMNNLKRFNAISVRDKLSVNITKKIFNIKNVSQVCDPIFICDLSEYEKLISKSKINKGTQYILAYILDPTIEKGHRLEKLSNDKNISVIIILDERQETWKINKEKLHLRGIGKVTVAEMVDLNDFLWYFKNSNSVFTDSFHGTIFSIIFKKPFVTLRNIARGGERFFSLLDPLDLRYRLFDNVNCINEHYDLYDKIDYKIPYLRLKTIKNNSYFWLVNALK